MYTEVLNLRIDGALAREISRIAERQGKSESETARNLLGLGVDVDRKIEAAYLMRPYDSDDPEPMRPVVKIVFEEFDPWIESQ